MTYSVKVSYVLISPWGCTPPLHLQPLASHPRCGPRKGPESKTKVFLALSLSLSLLWSLGSHYIVCTHLWPTFWVSKLTWFKLGRRHSISGHCFLALQLLLSSPYVMAKCAEHIIMSLFLIPTWCTCGPIWTDRVLVVRVEFWCLLAPQKSRRQRQIYMYPSMYCFCSRNSSLKTLLKISQIM